LKTASFSIDKTLPPPHPWNNGKNSTNLKNPEKDLKIAKPGVSV